MDRPEGDIVPGADTASAVVDAHGVVRAWSPGAERLIGRPAREVVDRPAAPLLAQDVSALARRCLAERAAWHGRVALRHADGRAVTARLVAAPSVDGAGETRWLLTASPWQRVEEHLRLLEWAFDQSGNALSVYDTQGRIRWTNAVSLERMGVDRDVAIGRETEDLLSTGGSGVAPDAPFLTSSPHIAEAIRRVAEVARDAGRRGRRQRLEFSTADDPATPENITWAVDISPVRAPDGEVRGVFAASSDISDQVAARRRLALLKEAGDRLGSTLEVTRTAQELTDIVVPDLADFASVELLPQVTGGGEPPPSLSRGEIRLRRVAHQSLTEGIPEAVVARGDTYVHRADSTTVRCLTEGRAIMADSSDPDFDRWSGEDPERDAITERFGFHSAMIVPLRARGTVLGTALFLRNRAAPFVRDDLLLAEELCARAAVSIDNARRYARERGTALALQRSLLPQRLQGHAAVRVASRYRPAGSRAGGVGGDWFDVVPLSGTRVALVIGDVVGHGLHASATMGRLRTAVRTLADVDLPPDELLTHLDDLVSHLAEQAGAIDPAASSVGEIGATCLYAIYDPVSRRCVVASAGHPPPVIVAPDGTPVRIDVTPGPPLGVGGLPFEASEVELPEGSLVALATNGLLTPRDRAFDTGQHLLEEVLAGPSESLEDVCDAVMSALLPDKQTDDAALLVARTRALDAEHVATLDLAADPSVVARARKAAADQLVAWNLPDAAFITELVVSELVTNAIRHAAPPIQLRLIRGESSLICEVSDSSSTAPHLRRARTYDEGGRGLLLVAQLTQQWGTRQTATGKTIWAEQQLGGPVG
ncbi:SpoIIE family protein phosphatase [Streptomyces sp. RFCAC02]|uniref:SpoIIE family protein phosphatase n=1 Tax=Streptomyces sp. RFCAC02 TaxID=2499143 RepID=UPI0010224ED4|nr:SpoIIE family protein phosphatase [Streptomyces sp. RFCAC02]